MQEAPLPNSQQLDVDQSIKKYHQSILTYREQLPENKEHTENKVIAQFFEQIDGLVTTLTNESSDIPKAQRLEQLQYLDGMLSVVLRDDKIAEIQDEKARQQQINNSHVAKLLALQNYQHQIDTSIPITPTWKLIREFVGKVILWAFVFLVAGLLTYTAAHLFLETLPFPIGSENPLVDLVLNWLKSLITRTAETPKVVGMAVGGTVGFFALGLIRQAQKIGKEDPTITRAKAVIREYARKIHELAIPDHGITQPKLVQLSRDLYIYYDPIKKRFYPHQSLITSALTLEASKKQVETLYKSLKQTKDAYSECQQELGALKRTQPSPAPQALQKKQQELSLLKAINKAAEDVYFCAHRSYACAVTADTLLSYCGKPIPQTTCYDLSALGEAKVDQSKIATITFQERNMFEHAEELSRDPAKKIAILNAMNAFTVGGGTFSGEGAQEETLCRASDTAVALLKHAIDALAPGESLYDLSIGPRHTPLTDTQAVISAEVTFTKHPQTTEGKGFTVRYPEYTNLEEKHHFQAHVLGNAGVDLREESLRNEGRGHEIAYPEGELKENDLKWRNEYSRLNTEKQRDRITSRIKAEMDAVRQATKKGVKITHLLLTAQGCGVFLCDPEIVGEIFAEVIVEGNYDHIVEAIHFDIMGRNYRSFKRGFDGKYKTLRQDAQITEVKIKQDPQQAAPPHNTMQMQLGPEMYIRYDPDKKQFMSDTSLVLLANNPDTSPNQRQIADTLLHFCDTPMPTTTVYTTQPQQPAAPQQQPRRYPRVAFRDENIFTCARELAEEYKAEGKTIAIQNAMNKTYIGGGVFRGNRAQEEEACIESNLSLALMQTSIDERPDDAKAYDAQEGRPRLYPDLQSSQALVTKDVTFYKDGNDQLLPNGGFTAHVFGNAAMRLVVPGYTAQQWKALSPEEQNAQLLQHNPEKMTRENEQEIRSLIRANYDALRQAGITVAVFTAPGCGAFRNYAPLIGQWCAEEMLEGNYHHFFEHIQFSIQNHGNKKTLDEFREGFKTGLVDMHPLILEGKDLVLNNQIFEKYDQQQVLQPPVHMSM